MTLNAERITASGRVPASSREERSPAGATGDRVKAGRAAGGSHRDAAIDAARAACLVVVFALHAMMVGVSVGAGGPVLENALEHWDGFAAATWFVQIMPLFFVIGGYSALSQWRRMQARGADAATYVRGRLARLVRPAIALVAVVALALAVLAAAGLPAEVVATAGYRIGQPLWFLAVYLACTSLVPLMAQAHARHPFVTVGALLAVVVAVDALRMSTGVDAIGFANLLAVWLLVQQGGFLLADGTVERMPRASRLVVAVAALGALAALTLAGPYSPDLLMNLNPPTVCLVVLGTAQLMLFSLVRPALRRWAERPRPARTIASFGEWGMTLYLWHMPAFILLAGVLLWLNGTVGLALPVPLEPEWWATRPIWLVAAAAVTAGFVRVFSRWERGGARRVGGPARVRVPVGVAAVCGILGVGLVLVFGFGPWIALAALVLLGVALRGSRDDSLSPSRDTRTAPASMSVGGGSMEAQHNM
ncbi:acyltransferase family protein [Agromyces allii]|uniref:Acyltransferase 3 domain-containing protein n=1 Tax=Agromyces allii TaxID=393607 RepID=A0ABN2RGE2_9MICO|nr:acyltransferase [Agromyces allii]